MSVSTLSAHTFPFLALPRELRDQIYEHALVSPKPIVPVRPEAPPRFRFNKHQTQSVNLSYTCKQTLQESLQIYFGMNTFSFKSTHALAFWMAFFQQGERRLLFRNIKLRCFGSKNIAAYKMLARCPQLEKLNLKVYFVYFENRLELYHPESLDALKGIRCKELVVKPNPCDSAAEAVYRKEFEEILRGDMCGK